MATTTMNISLPETMKAFIEERLVRDGYGTVSEYVRELIRADQKRQAEAELEKLLMKRLQTSEVSEFDIKKVKSALDKHLTKKRATK